MRTCKKCNCPIDEFSSSDICYTCKADAKVRLFITILFVLFLIFMALLYYFPESASGSYEDSNTVSEIVDSVYLHPRSDRQILAEINRKYFLVAEQYVLSGEPNRADTNDPNIIAMIDYMEANRLQADYYKRRIWIQENPQFDLNSDGVLDLKDLAVFCDAWAEYYSL